MCWLCTFIAGSAIFVVYIGVVAYKQGKIPMQELGDQRGLGADFQRGLISGDYSTAIALQTSAHSQLSTCIM